MIARWLADPVHFAIAAIYGILIFASLVTYVLCRMRPGEATQELKKRVTSWWWMITVFTIAILTARAVSTVFLGFVAFLALKEYLSLIPTRRVDRAILIWMYLAIPVQFYLAHEGMYGLSLVFIPVWMFLFLPACITIGGHTEGFLRAVGTLSWGLMITVFSLSHTALLLKFGVNHGIGAGALLFLVALTQFNDVAQFTTGKLLGRHKIIPRVSPKKTWEGFIGGLVFTTGAAALVGPVLTPMTPEWSAVAGFIIAVSGFLGDVTISACKRDLGVKDASQLIPGHGGILDRVDSLIYSAPVFFHFLNYFFGNWPANPL
ncbi:MAG TPA: phosphatidate cytidylyltransferase [Rhizomicrobium sp.]|nr:phosphatidate cytidylyltransferase [Rhizomicrobium sp.]